jgi:probable F420-dependent oxidoreductase
MKLSAYLGQGAVRDVVAHVPSATRLGLHRVWTSELSHDPFLPLAVASHQAPELAIGTSIAVSFARTPWAMAEAAWDLSQLSGGRFVLGLGTQVRAHVERRMGATWAAPAGYTRDYVGALRAIWDHWSVDGPLAFESEHFNLSLSTPLFRPEPGGAPPPVFMGGVNPGMCRVAADIADGFIAHGFHSRDYLVDQVLPLLFGDRDRDSMTVVVPVIVAMGTTAARRDAAREAARRQVAFYASTPAYRTILAQHGLEELGERLTALARVQRWDDMATAVDDDVLDLHAVGGTPEETARTLVRRYHGVADEILVMRGLHDGDLDDWDGLTAAFARASRDAEAAA